MVTSDHGVIQKRYLDGDFLQSSEWRKFQESVGRKTHDISNDDFHASIIEHTLPVTGKYFYVPRGPIMCHPELACLSGRQVSGSRKMLKQVQHDKTRELIQLAKENNAGWIRIEPATEEILKDIKNNIKNKIAKAPHDVQPKELFIIDITKPEEQLLAEMKPKTRYNIRVAQKHGVKISASENVDEFIRLTEIMAKRQGILAHPESYYRKMLEVIPGDILKLYVAKYEGKIVAANLVVFYGKMCIYLHGASDDQYRNVMAPFLLQWQQIQDAKTEGCEKYDFGGVKINSTEGKSWAGVTRFKIGFSPNTKSTEFPGCYDIIIDRKKYLTYLFLGKLMPIWKKIKRK